jgi:hypothetical protein
MDGGRWAEAPEGEPGDTTSLAAQADLPRTKRAASFRRRLCPHKMTQRHSCSRDPSPPAVRAQAWFGAHSQNHFEPAAGEKQAPKVRKGRQKPCCRWQKVAASPNRDEPIQAEVIWLNPEVSYRTSGAAPLRASRPRPTTGRDARPSATLMALDDIGMACGCECWTLL